MSLCIPDDIASSDSQILQPDWYLRISKFWPEIVSGFQSNVMSLC